MIQYVIRAKKNNFSENKTVKYYPQITPSSPVNVREIAKRIEKACTVSSADVKAVLDTLQTEVIEALLSGNTVRLGDLGSFRLTLSASGCETTEEAKKAGANLIKKVNVRFTKSGKMRQALRLDNLKFGIQSYALTASE